MLRAVATDLDARIRAAAFSYLDRAGAREVPVDRPTLEAFVFEGVRVPLLARQRGIWKPRFLDAALSVLTTYVGPNERPPYDDEMGADGYPRYKWRGADPSAYDNVALRVAMARRLDLIWFVGVRPGWFRALYPVKLAGEEPEHHQFVVAFDETMEQHWSPSLLQSVRHDPVRRYAEALVRVRLHQRPFHDRVLLAYESQCALCRLRHPRLLDAAHIKEDADGGEPVVPNGMAMCAIHHRAFDAHVLGVRPDYRIEIQPTVLAEHDGPTLRHALQGLHGQVITLPRRRGERPDPLLLEERYERFRRAG